MICGPSVLRGVIVALHANYRSRTLCTHIETEFTMSEHIMSNFIASWLRDESGAVTVDWVVLTAAVVGLGFAAVASARTGVVSLASKIGQGVEVTSLGN